MTGEQLALCADALAKLLTVRGERSRADVMAMLRHLGISDDESAELVTHGVAFLHEGVGSRHPSARSIIGVNMLEALAGEPYIGSIHGALAGERALSRVSQAQARFAILDLTGVDAIDTSTASHILKLIQALRLLGTEGVISGIRSNVAQTMVALGVGLEGVVTLTNLRSALQYCIKSSRTGIAVGA